MKITWLLLTVALVQVSASSYSQQTKLTLNLQDVMLKEVFEEIENTSEFRFFYDSKEIDPSAHVSVNTKDSDIKIILEQILNSSNITYEIIDRYIVLKKDKETTGREIALAGQQDGKTVTGTIRDAGGEPIPGASIVVKGTVTGTISNMDGNFTLSGVPEDAILQFSFVGMIGVEVPAAGKTTFDIVLQEETLGLEEVIVIGYGEQTRTKVAGAVGKIEESDLEKVASPSFEQQLAGKMSGVIVNQSDGQPGAGSQIVIRGIGTLTAGTNPLIVVDGFPLTEGSSLNSINTNDIADISILKDAASASIYGSRAANGVILVTTKKGTTDEKARISLDVYGGFQQQSSGVELLDAYDFAQFLSEGRDWGYVSKDPNDRSINDPNSVRVTKKINGKNIDGRELRLDYLQPYLDGTPWPDQYRLDGQSL